MLLTADQHEAMAETFEMSSDPTRLRIILALDRAGERRVHELAADIGAGETKIRHALRLLRTAGVVRNRRDGRHVHDRLADDHVRVILRTATDHLAECS